MVASVAQEQEKTCHSSRRSVLAALMSLFVTSGGGIAQTSSTPGFSGRAYVVQATVPPLSPITVADTGQLSSSGGAQEASLLDVPAISLGTVGALNGADVAHSTTIGRGNASRSEASVADLSLTVAGNTIAADFLMSDVTAQCNGASPSVSGRSDLARLVVNDQSIDVSGATNQTIQLPLNAGAVIVNEQSSSVSGQSGTMDVNALHVVVNNPAPGGAPLADVIISHAHADITCPVSPPPCDATAGDFVTGGGWVVSPSDSNAKANFAVAGGIKNGSFWGHLMYLDHGNRLRVKGTAVKGYDTYPEFGPNGRQTSGSADVDGTAESYEADVADDGEPGRGVDRFRLLLNGARVTGLDDYLAGGNIQVHKQQCQ